MVMRGDLVRLAMQNRAAVFAPVGPVPNQFAPNVPRWRRDACLKCPAAARRAGASLTGGAGAQVTPR